MAISPTPSRSTRGGYATLFILRIIPHSFDYSIIFKINGKYVVYDQATGAMSLPR